MNTPNAKVMTVGHDHVNDYCGRWHGIELCYGGGAGFHAYGKTGWARRARFFELDASGTITCVSYLTFGPSPVFSFPPSKRLTSQLLHVNQPSLHCPLPTLMNGAGHGNGSIRGSEATALVR
jgi:hypothetical protein